jgi:hypothetical protein
VQLSPCNLKFNGQAFAALGVAFLFAIVAFLPQALARNLASDPNAVQKIEQFIYKPKPDELLLKPAAKPKKPAKGAKK